MVVRRPAIEAVLPTMIEFIGDSVIVGHNVGFDMAFINAALCRRGDPALVNPVVDTLPLARRLIRDEVPDCRLGTLASRFRLDHRPTHRALDDALATTDLLHLLLERAAGFGVLGLDDLIALPRIGAHPAGGQAPPHGHLAAQPRRVPLPWLPATRCSTSARPPTSANGCAATSAATIVARSVTLLREAQRITHVATPNVLAAEVLELRYLQHLAPRYNRVGTTPQKYRYVRLSTDEAWPRLSVVNEATGCRRAPRPAAFEGQRRRRRRGDSIGVPAAPLHGAARPHVPAATRRDHVHPGPAGRGDVPVRRRCRRRPLRGRGRRRGAGDDHIARAGHRTPAGPAATLVGRRATLRGGRPGPRPGDRPSATPCAASD